jgi:hypothetical protein
VGLTGAEQHSLDGVQQFAGHGHQRQTFGFAFGEQVFIEPMQVWFAPAGHQRGHKQNVSQVAVSSLRFCSRLFALGLERSQRSLHL